MKGQKRKRGRANAIILGHRGVDLEKKRIDKRVSKGLGEGEGGG